LAANDRASLSWSVGAGWSIKIFRCLHVCRGNHTSQLSIRPRTRRPSGRCGWTEQQTTEGAEALTSRSTARRPGDSRFSSQVWNKAEFDNDSGSAFFSHGADQVSGERRDRGGPCPSLPGTPARRGRGNLETLRDRAGFVFLSCFFALPVPGPGVGT
jgi:hypothetical protein